MSPKLRVDIPSAFEELFRAHRYHVYYGGRGSAKSWSVARALVLKAYRSPRRILCTREIQGSIAESVHHLLEEQINEMGLAPWFDVRERYIACRLNGSNFLFKGLRHNVTEIKSTEGVTDCWVEEAEKVSSRSWSVLIPTIRMPGSEIIVTFNPADEKDPTYQRFVVSPPPDAFVKKVSWRDNPHFGKTTLPAEMEYLRRVDMDAYLHVWEGECRVASAAQVLNGKWTIDTFEPVTRSDDRSQVWDGPYYGVDFGFAEDPSTMLRVWVHNRKLYVEHEAYGLKVESDDLPRLFDKVPGGKDYVSRGDCARPETISYLRRNGYPRMVSVDKWPGSVEDGIAHLRQYEQIVIHPRCPRTAEEARLWSYKQDRLTGDVMPDLVDANNHCWDAIRYALAPLVKRSTPGEGFLAYAADALARKRAEDESRSRDPKHVKA